MAETGSVQFFRRHLILFQHRLLWFRYRRHQKEAAAHHRRQRQPNISPDSGDFRSLRPIRKQVSDEEDTKEERESKSSIKTTVGQLPQ